MLNLGHYLWTQQGGDLGDKPIDTKAVQGNYFYSIYNAAEVTRRPDWFGYDHRLAVADLSDPRDPLVIGDWDDPDDAWLYGVSLNRAGTRAYVVGLTVPASAKGANWPYDFARFILYVLDIEDPKSPVQIGRYVHPTAPPNSHVPYAVPNEDDTLVIVADGSYAGMTEECGGHGILHFLDISDLTSIREISTFSIEESATCPGGESQLYQAMDMAVKGNLVYSTWLRGGLHVVDISDPANPVEVGEFRSPDNIGPWLSDVALYSDASGDYALASTVWWSGLYVLKMR